MDKAGFPNGSRCKPRIPLPLGSAYFFAFFRFSTILFGSFNSLIIFTPASAFLSTQPTNLILVYTTYTRQSNSWAFYNIPTLILSQTFYSYYSIEILIHSINVSFLIAILYIRHNFQNNKF